MKNALWPVLVLALGFAARAGNAPAGASLDAGRVTTGLDGRAQVKLHAPSMPASGYRKTTSR